jgi:structure-specific recognition protein 1
MVKKFLCEPVKMKALKDPNKPKRSKSSYLFFCDAHRQKVLDKLRKSKNVPKNKIIVEVSKKLGSMWKSLDTDGKAPFEAKAQADKERYKDEMEAYNA